MCYFYKIFIVTTIILLSAAPPTWTFQEPTYTKPPEIPKFTIEVARVYLPVVVSNPSGKKPVFRVFEKIGRRGQFVEQKIERIEDPGKPSIRGGVLIDTSGSVSEDNQFLYQRDSAAELVKLICNPILRKNSTKETEGRDKPEEDKIFLAEFYYEPNDANPREGIHRVRLNWTNKLKPLVEAIVALKPGGWSPIFDSIAHSSSKFLEVGGIYSTFLIVFSDGYHQMPDDVMTAKDIVSVTLLQAVRAAQTARLPVYTINTLDMKRFPKESETYKKSALNLSEMARLTGGRYFEHPKLENIPRIAKQIIGDLQSRYYLEYGLNPEYKSGNEISLRVEVGEYDNKGQWKKWPNTRLLYREGYIVKK